MIYKAVSLFSGCGGSSLGYKMAEFKVLASNEFIPEAQETYKANFPDTHLFTEDIRVLTGEQILSQINMKAGELDLLDGSPPCAAFSSVGKRVNKDITKFLGKKTKYSGTEQVVDDLFFEYIRILNVIQPKVFVAENVEGLIKAKAINVFNKVIQSMRDCGYNVSCRLLNAKYLGVPQLRPRLIFIGVRKDLGIMPSHPLPSSREITLKEALEGVKNEQWELDASKYKETSSVYPLLLKMKPGETGDKYADGSYFSLARLRWDRPANAILQADGKHTSSRCVHPTENRRLTITELKRVGSFPEHFKLTGNYAQQWERIGRAVPPVMMFKVAQHIKIFILDKIYGVKQDYVLNYFDIDNDKEYSLNVKEYEKLLDRNPFQEYGKYTGTRIQSLF